MKRNLVVFFFLALMLVSCGPNRTVTPNQAISPNQAVTPNQAITLNRHDMKQAQLKMADYMKKFPQSTLCDVYKCCFQNYFGPGHIIDNREDCKQYIVKELEYMKRVENKNAIAWSEPYAPTLPDGKYVRVSLLYVNDSLLPLDSFADELMRSATVIHPINVEQWTKIWAQLMVCIHPYKDQLENFEHDSTTIAQMLKEGNYVMHHSTKFNNAYNFHYRLIRADIFNKEILPLLEKKKSRKLKLN